MIRGEDVSARSARSFEVVLEPGGASFEVRPGEPILNAALRQRVALRYGCRHGRCSSCKYRVLEGDFDAGDVSPYCLGAAEQEEGWALLCRATALTDLVLDEGPRRAGGLRPVIPPSEREARVEEAVGLSESLWLLRVELDAPLDFYPGQFVELSVPGREGEWRSYSIATAPSTMPRMELVIKRIPAGAFSGRLAELRRGTRLALRGPFGTGYLRDGDRPAIFVAAGSGIAPILSILRDAADRGLARPSTLFYGARTLRDLAFREELSELEKRLPAFRFRATLSRPTEACAWPGPTGRVQSLVQRELDDGAECEAYLCGAPEMCDSVALLLEAKGLDEDRIYFDRFYSAV